MLNKLPKAFRMPLMSVAVMGGAIACYNGLLPDTQKLSAPQMLALALVIPGASGTISYLVEDWCECRNSFSGGRHLPGYPAEQGNAQVSSLPVPSHIQDTLASTDYVPLEAKAGRDLINTDRYPTEPVEPAGLDQVWQAEPDDLDAQLGL